MDSSPRLFSRSVYDSTVLDIKSHCLVVAFMIALRLMQTRSSAYRSRIHIIPDMIPHKFPHHKGRALVIKPFLEANSFPALVGHIMSHSYTKPSASSGARHEVFLRI